MPKTFRELEVWNKSIDLTTLVYDSPRPSQSTKYTASLRRCAARPYPFRATSLRVRHAAPEGISVSSSNKPKAATANCKLNYHRASVFSSVIQQSSMTRRALSLEIGKMLGGLSAYLAREIQANRSTPPNAHLTHRMPPTDNLQPATCNSLHIRPATPDDIPEILAFIRELADYEREPASAVATHADLLRDGFGPETRASTASSPRWLQLTASNLQPATSPRRLRLYFYNYSTWRGHAGIYVEDIFVRPHYRGKGIGKALLTASPPSPSAEGCPRLEWAVLDWNTPAIDFYNSLGANAMSEWTIMRLSGQTLAQLAHAR